MSTFQVSARKYRPATFDAVVGQPTVTQTLKGAIRSGQIAHAYLFSGPRGVGKTTCARIFAKTLNCFNLTDALEPCGQCESCRSFHDSRSFNIHELDAASNNSVEDIRSLIDKIRILPQVGRYSIYIIDEVHMLSQSAFNAFLKTLEEPPAHAIFILATTEKHKIIPTILSRCQIFDFQRIRVEDMVGYLRQVADKEGIRYEEEALNVIALKADGALRDALSVFDQVASFTQKNITYSEVLENLNVLDYEYYFRMTDAFLEHNAQGALILFNEVLQRGFDGLNFLGGLTSHLRDLLVCSDPVTLQLLEVGEAFKARYQKQAAGCQPDFLFSALEICSQCELSYKASRNPRLHVELALLRLCHGNGEKKKLSPDREIPEVPEIIIKAETKKAAITSAPKPPVRGDGYRQITPELKNPSLISIKEALSNPVGNTDPGIDAVEESPPAEKNLKPLSSEFMILCWNAYADQIRDERPRMAVTLKNVQPGIEGDSIIRIDLNNRDQLEDFIATTRNALERFLRREMQNDAITIEPKLVENTGADEVRLYTSEEKFRYLSTKNPLLGKLRQDLNLELD